MISFIPKVKVLIFSVIVMAVLMSCAQTIEKNDDIISKDIRIIEELKTEKNYTIGQESTAYIGEAIIKKKSFFIKTAIDNNIKNVVEMSLVENFEIIFSGITNGQINLVYRSYSEDKGSNTDFFHQLAYPKNSEFIRYKSLKIKLHDVTEESLKYEVIEE